MSKKDRLDAQKKKQDILRREQEEQERLEKEEAQHKRSKAARRFAKQAKRKNGSDPSAFFLLKLLMLVPFAYSGIFYGGVVLSGIWLGYIEPPPPSWVGWSMLAGIILIGAGIVIEFFRRHIISFGTIAAGTVFYMRSAGYLIGKIKDRLDKYYVDPDRQNMDKEYMGYFYPMYGVIVISLVILAAWTVRKAIEAKKQRHERDTAPVKSIIDDDGDKAETKAEEKQEKPKKLKVKKKRRKKK
ncbi:MAG: hypothetical protein IJ737_08045 [Ruminococcus sp.]|nr:hypothetical protein [Ruminococcus sp.]